MASCNMEAAAKNLKGEERSKFMSSCLSAAPGKTSQQDKMTTCNRDASARQLKGDQCQAFMSNCLGR